MVRPTGSALAPAIANDGDASAVLARALGYRDQLSAAERTALASAVGEVRIHPAGNTLIRAHTPTESSTLLIEGFLSREYSLAEGKRQIVAVHVPGDFVDLHSLLLKQLDHDVVALSDVRVALFPHEALREITRAHPHLTRLLWLLTMIDAAVHREWISRLGHSAVVRIAHLLCELHARLDVAGLVTDTGFMIDLTQADLGDMTGLTAVHVNRTLRKLRELNLAVVRAGYASIPDIDALRRFAGFDDTYLYINAMPR